MRIHTSLSAAEVLGALPEGVHAYIMPKDSRKRDHAFEVTLYVYDKDDLHRRLGNSGGYGASTDVAATWDEWGIWIDRLYDADPELLCSYYDSRENFIAETTRHRDYVRQYNKPESLKWRTHLAPWLD